MTLLEGGKGRVSPSEARLSSGPMRITAAPATHAAIASRKPKTPEIRGLTEAGDPGIEPGVAVLETTVLPIHQSPGDGPF